MFTHKHSLINYFCCLIWCIHEKYHLFLTWKTLQSDPPNQLHASNKRISRQFNNRSSQTNRDPSTTEDRITSSSSSSQLATNNSNWTEASKEKQQECTSQQQPMHSSREISAPDDINLWHTVAVHRSNIPRYSKQDLSIGMPLN